MKITILDSRNIVIFIGVCAARALTNYNTLSTHLFTFCVSLYIILFTEVNCLSVLLYAYDLTLMFRKENDLQIGICALRNFGAYNLEVSIRKPRIILMEKYSR